MVSLLLTLCLVSAPVPPSKMAGIQDYQLTGEYHDTGAPEAWMERRFVLSCDGGYWSYWNGEEYAGTWKYDRAGNRVVILERPAHNPARPLQEWAMWNVGRRGGIVRVSRYVRVR